MKKWMSCLSILLMAALVFTGCGSNGSNGSNSQANGGQQSTTASKSTDWPKKSIQMVVPYAAGGDTDYNAREYAKYLEKKLGQSVAVVNTEGAGGSLAAETVRNNPADGYTIFFANTGFLFNNITGISDYTFDEAFDTIGVVAKSAGECITVRKSCKATTVPELLKMSQTEQMKLTSVTGGIMQYMAVRLNDLGGKFTLVDAGGVNDRIAALKGSHVDAIINTVKTVKPYVDSGDFKILALTTAERSKAYPDIPTCHEQGVDLDIGLEYNMFVKKGTDEAIVSKLTQAAKEISEDADYAKDIKSAYDQTPFFVGSSDGEKRLKDQFEEFKKYQKLFQG